MTSVSDLRSTLRQTIGGSTPALALVGVADLAAETLKAAAARAPLDPTSREELRAKLTEGARGQVQQQVDHGLALFHAVASRAAHLDPALLRARLEPTKLREDAAHAQTKVVSTVVSTALSTALTTAGRVESEVTRLVARGRAVVGVPEPVAEPAPTPGRVTLTRTRPVSRPARRAPGSATAGVPVVGKAAGSADASAGVPVVGVAGPAGAEYVADLTANGARRARATKAEGTAARKTAKTPVRGAGARGRATAPPATPSGRARARKSVAAAPVDAVTPRDVAPAVDPDATKPAAD